MMSVVPTSSSPRPPHPRSHNPTIARSHEALRLLAHPPRTRPTTGRAPDRTASVDVAHGAWPPHTRVYVRIPCATRALAVWIPYCLPIEIPPPHTTTRDARRGGLRRARSRRRRRRRRRRRPAAAHADRASGRRTMASTPTTMSGRRDVPSVYDHAIAGQIAGMVGLTLVHPLDTVKSRLQTGCALAQTLDGRRRGAYGVAVNLL